MQVTFIIPALNEERHLPRCLGSIAALEVPAAVTGIEVVVVDSKSTDRTAEVAREHGARVVPVEPGLIARSRNTGARESGGELLAFVDADCELSRDWLVRCVGHLADPGVLAAGTGMAPPAADVPWVEKCWHELAHAHPSGESERVDWLASFNLIVRRSAFDAVGGFDEALVTCEDSDFGYKLAKRGVLMRDHVATTAHHGESKTLGQFYRREAWRSCGNLPVLSRQGVALRELPSLVIPPMFALSLLAGVVLFCLALIWPWLAWAAVSSLAVAVLLPMLMLLRRGVHPGRPGLFCQCWVLACVYLWARAVGMLMPMRRVAR
jgi:glycosyltransferase involved in cell wall biosynthesis